MKDVVEFLYYAAPIAAGVAALGISGVFFWVYLFRSPNDGKWRGE